MRLDPKVKKALEETGLPWAIETGSKHFKIRLGGRLAGTFPLGKKTEAAPHANQNIIATIKRMARELA